MDKGRTLSVGVGDIKIAKAPTVITTYLGSCVAVCLYSARHKVGGMLHLMLPQSRPSKDGAALKKEKYADTGIPELLRQLKVIFNIEKENFVAKIFGGASILTNVRQHIGDENLKAVHDILNDLKIPVIGSHVGGDRGYKIEFDVGAGKVLCRVFGEQPKEY